MNTIGIVAEFNPFHNGHQYLINRVKDLYRPDCLIVAMSGNFVQRGEPAIFNKWLRAEMALISGADIIVQIPEFFCLSDAGTYARAALRVLSAMGVKTICYGSESGNEQEINELAIFLTNFKSKINEITSKLQSQGISYPKARQEAISYIFPETLQKSKILNVLSNPNDTLGLEYTCASFDYDIKCIPIPRLETLSECVSASKIRSMILTHTDYTAYVPSQLNNFYQSIEYAKLDEKFLLDLLRYRLYTDSSSLDDVPSGGEGLGSRLLSSVQSAVSLEDLIQTLKTKQITYTRTSRYLMQFLLGFRRDEFSVNDINYTRLLGIKESATLFLKDFNPSGLSDFHIINNFSRDVKGLTKDCFRLLQSDIKAARIYDLITKGKSKSCQEFSRHAIILDN